MRGADDRRETRANRFASCFLMPPAFLARLPSPADWTDADAIHWANEMRVSCKALGIALKEAGLVDAAKGARIEHLRVDLRDKVDPELPVELGAAQRDRKRALLDLGLSNHYVDLCFEARRRDMISLGKLAEALLCSSSELSSLATLYGASLHGH